MSNQGMALSGHREIEQSSVKPGNSVLDTTIKRPDTSHPYDSRYSTSGARAPQTTHATSYDTSNPGQLGMHQLSQSGASSQVDRFSTPASEHSVIHQG